MIALIITYKFELFPLISMNVQLCFQNLFEKQNDFSQGGLSYPGLFLFSLLVMYTTPGTAACQASLSFPISWSLLNLMSIELVMPSKLLVLCHPLLLPSVFPGIKVFSNESALCIRWPKYWSFSFGIRHLIFLSPTPSTPVALSNN